MPREEIATETAAEQCAPEKNSFIMYNELYAEDGNCWATSAEHAMVGMVWQNHQYMCMLV